MGSGDSCHPNRADGFDEFLNAFVDTVELAGCRCGGSGKDDKLHMCVTLGRLADDPVPKLRNITDLLKTRPDANSWQTGNLFDVWHDSTGRHH